MSLGFGFSLPAYLGSGGAFAGASLNLDFTNGNNTLSPLITFSRTTNATLTNSAGLVANAPMNLLTFSEQFDSSAWGKSASTVSANTTAAPNGTLTADSFLETATTDFHSISSSPTMALSTRYTFSIYAKPNGRNWLVMNIFTGAASTRTWFDVANGVVGTVGAGATAAISSAGNGWYRCSIAVDTASSGSPNLAIWTATADNNFFHAGDITKGLFIWGAQLELGSTATTYNPTTVKNLLGFTENFDNAAWTKSNAFVQTNLLLQSEAFDSASWIKDAGVSVSANTTAAPDGTSTADTVTWASAANIYQGTIVGTGALTFSTYARVASGTANFLLQVFNATDGTLSSTTLTATTSWQRFSFNFTVTANSFWIIRSTVAQSIFIWGAQLVQGATPGDYKATYAAAAAVGYTDIYGQPFAQKLVENTAATIEHYVASPTASVVVGTPYTYTTYAKAGERSQIQLRMWASGSFQYLIGTFNLLTGTIVGSLAPFMVTSPTFSITSVGEGWYRISLSCALTAGATGVQGWAMNAVAGSATYTGDGTSGIYIFGAQLSDSASVDPYVYQPVAAPSSVAYYGPRFDYDPVTLAPKGLLIEEQRTNLLLNTSILGTQVVTVTAAAHTLSFYGTGTIVLSGAFVGTVTGTGAYPTRTTLTFTPIVGVLTVTVTGSVTSAQLEAGAFATSYIPTVASQVTRAVDSASMIGNNFARWYNVNTGTFYAQSASFGDAAVRYITFASDGTNNNRIAQYFSTGSMVGLVTAGGTSQASMSVAGTTAAKTALAYATDNFAFARNGTLATDSAGTVPVGLTQMQIGAGLTAATSPLNGTIARIAFYQRRLANTELQGITS